MHRTRTWLSATLMALVAVTALSGTAWAHHRPDHEGGNPKAGQVTEDDDADGVPNAPDPNGDSDNRHPSGKDKHEEAGGSGNQGSSSSEPDGNGNGPERDQGGLDKPDGPGGLDVQDQDGNNGCGNDDDFEDDNEGLCLGGRKDKEDQDAVVPPEELEGADQGQPEGGIETAPGEFGLDEVVPAEIVPIEVLGEVITAGAPGEEDVLGATARGPAGPAAPVVAGVPLAFTGIDALALILAAAALAVVGLVLVTLGRRTGRA